MKNNLKLITSTALLSLLGLYGYFSTKPTVSVVMPVYNRADLLPRAIDSILNQTYKDFEFIIIDDASTDASASIAQQYAQKDKRIKLFVNDANKGIAFSRNKGMEKAKGKYIAIMDSDDQALPFRLEKSIRILEENPNFDALSGTTINIEEKLSAQEILKWRAYTPIKNNFTISFIFNNSFANASAIFKQNFVKEHLIRYNESYISAEDYDFWKQFVLNGGKLLTIHEPLTFVRKHFLNSEKYYEEMKKNSKKVHRELISQFFEPTEDDVKLNYTLKEKCALLEKLENANNQKNIVSKEDMFHYKNSFCPPQTGEKYYITFPEGEDFIYLQNNQYIKWLTRTPVKLQKTDDTLSVQTHDGKTETYMKHAQKDEYFYFSTQNFKIHHTNWQDFIVQNKQNPNLFCRTQMSDCGELIEKSTHKITIKWENHNYPIESFVFDTTQKAYIKK